MKKIVSCLLAVSSLLILNACQKPEVDVDSVSTSQTTTSAALKPSPEKPISVVDGRLVFADGNAFSTAVKDLQNIKNYTEWEAKYSGFISTRTSYDKWTAQDDAAAKATLSNVEKIVKKVITANGVPDYQRIIPDDLLATLISKDGLVQIGDTVCLVTESAILKVPSKSIQELYVSSSNQLTIAPIINLPVNFSVKQQSDKRIESVLDQDSYDELGYYYDGDNYRFRPNWWAIRYNFTQSYTSTGIKIDHQRSGTFAWRTSNAFNWRCTYSWYITRVYDGAVVLDQFQIVAPTANDQASYQPFRTEFSPSPPSFHVKANGTWIATGRNGQNYSLFFSIDTITG